MTNDQGESFLLRITPIEQYEYKKAEFENMQMISGLGVPMCQPIEFGTCDEGVYSLQSWGDGVDAEEVESEHFYNYPYNALEEALVNVTS